MQSLCHLRYSKNVRIFLKHDLNSLPLFGNLFSHLISHTLLIFPNSTKVALGSRHLLFDVGNSQLICRRLEGEFLDYKAAIPRKNPIAITANTKSLMTSIDRVSVVISEKQKSPIQCVFDSGRVTMTAKTVSGEAKDICAIDGDGNGLIIGFNNRYLLEALKYAPADEVRLELNTGISPCVILPTEGEERFLYMVLPVRLKNN